MLVSQTIDPRMLLADVRAVVVDEIHAFAGDDRAGLDAWIYGSEDYRVRLAVTGRRQVSAGVTGSVAELRVGTDCQTADVSGSLRP